MLAGPPLTATLNCALDGETYNGRRRVDDEGDAGPCGTIIESFADATAFFEVLDEPGAFGSSVLVPCDEHADAKMSAAAQNGRRDFIFMLLHRYRGSSDAHRDACAMSGVIA